VEQGYLEPFAMNRYEMGRDRTFTWTSRSSCDRAAEDASRRARGGSVGWAGRGLSGAQRAALPAEPGIEPRRFIAHRGVHLRMTLAGENSLEAIRYARRAGFAAIETDVRLTSDGHAIVMHDDTLNRTCLHADGTALREKVPVAAVTLAQLPVGLRAASRAAGRSVAGSDRAGVPRGVPAPGAPAVHRTEAVRCQRPPLPGHHRVG
jgi:hypothetical protein